MKTFITLFSILFLCSCSIFSKNDLVKKEDVEIEIYSLKTPPVIGTTSSAQSISLGGFNGIIHHETRENSHYFYVVNNQGPKVDLKNQESIFLIPEFSPAIYVAKTNYANQEFEIAAKLNLYLPNNELISGRPITREHTNPKDVYGIYESLDSQGFSTIGITKSNTGGFWIADEYLPSLAQFSVNGILERRLYPTNGLPKSYGEKKFNEGFKALSYFANHLFAFIPNFTDSKIYEYAKTYRIAEVDALRYRTVNEYIYPVSHVKDELIAAYSISDRKIVTLEKLNNGTYDLFVINNFSPDKVVNKQRLFNVSKILSNKLNEKITGLTIINEKSIALVTDNNYQINGTTDTKSGLTPLNKKLSHIIILKLKKPVFEI